MAAAAGVAVAAAIIVIAVNRPPAAPPVRSEAAGPTLAEASAAAKKMRRPVEVDRLGTGTTRTYAEPDGTFTQRSTARPTRVRRGGAWVPVDTTLSEVDGAVRPGATSLAMVFSGGGTGPLITVAGDSWSFRLTWSAPLPAPVLAGGTATYPDVLPGVDLVVVVTGADGFAERLVVKSRSAAANPALSRISFATRTRGAALSAEPDGSLSLVGNTGATLVSAPAPMMWDSAAWRRPVGLTIHNGVVELRPDTAMLSDPAVRYPVTIDPSFSSRRQNWAEVLSGTPAMDFWNGQGLVDPTDGNGPMMVGRDPAVGDVARGYFQMDTGGVVGKHILKATFQVTEKWTRSCNQPTGVQLWETNAVNSKDTTWNSQPAHRRQLGEVTAAVGNEGLGCPDKGIEFDATQGVRDAAASGWNTLTLELVASNENDQWSWKRFDINPTIAINYNSVPNAPSGPVVEGHGCFTGASRPFVGTTTPRMTVNVSDPDPGTLLDTSFYWAPVGQSTNSTDKVTQNDVPTGSVAAATITAGRLVDGASYLYRSQATDGIDTSSWSAQCEFTVDATRPNQPPVVESADYPDDNNFHGGQGHTAPFTFHANGVADVAAYRYGWAEPPTTQVAASALAGDVTIAGTPPAQGLNRLFVRSVDRAGNLSDITAYTFFVGSPDAPVARWAADEGSGSSLSDASGNGRTVTLTGGTSWTAGRTAGPDRAVSFTPASPGYGTTVDPVVDTSGSYSVAAWVRLRDTTAYHGVLSQDGTHDSGFQLQFDATCTCWDMVVPASDVIGSTTLVARAPSPAKIGVWTHLAAVFDSGAKRLTLYVNGNAVSTVAGPSLPWRASGSFELGRTLWNDGFGSYFAGDIDDVRVWQRVILPTEVEDLASKPVLTGQWDLDEGSGTAARDSSGRGQDVALNGGTGWTTGYNFLGALHLDSAAHGYGSASGPVVDTSGSYSVAAWVRLTDTTAYHGVLSQDGTHDSGFQLQFDPTCSCWDVVVPASDVVGATAQVVRSPSPADVGVWTHLAAVFDEASGTVKLYVNGTLVATKAGLSTPWPARGPFEVGRTMWADAFGSYFAGDIDNVRVYAGALSDGDIVDLANQ